MLFWFISDEFWTLEYTQAAVQILHEGQALTDVIMIHSQ